MQIYLIPTYECELACPSCYSKKYQEKYPNYLSWVDFVNIFSCFKDECKGFSFIGGEPTKWKFINEALIFLNNKGLKTTLFTNATRLPTFMPDYVTVNGSTIVFTPDLKERVLRNISVYRTNNVKTRLRFNISQNLPKPQIGEIIRISREYADSVSLSILYPAIFNRKLGELVFLLSKQLSSESIPIKISRATPLCIFTQKEIVFLEENCHLRGVCPLPSNAIVINPDGRTIQPCVELDSNHSVHDLTNSSAKNIFSDEIELLKTLCPSFCQNCTYFLQNKCCGGCLGYKNEM